MPVDRAAWHCGLGESCGKTGNEGKLPADRVPGRLLPIPRTVPQYQGQLWLEASQGMPKGGEGNEGGSRCGDSVVKAKKPSVTRLAQYIHDTICDNLSDIVLRVSPTGPTVYLRYQ